MPDSPSLLYYLLIGGLLGATLNYFQFGFSSSFRSLIIDRNTVGFRALLWMLGLAILLFSPLLTIESWQGQSFQGFIRPLSLAVAIGAFIFGIGMQIGCGCTSGTLNRVGQLQPLSFITLMFMIVGGTIAAATYNEWQFLPALAPVAFQHSFGVLPGLVIQLFLLAGLYKLLIWYETRRHGQVEPLLITKNASTVELDNIGGIGEIEETGDTDTQNRTNTLGRITTLSRKKIHPFLLAGLLLATLNAALLLTTGSPWSISSVFPFWGAKLMTVSGLPVEWSFWDYALQNSPAIHQGWFEHPVSLTTLGVIFGALVVSIVHPRTKVKLSRRTLSMGIGGGLIMGFGAVMASGCNIGAFFSGIASGSLHGWLWLVFALFGNLLGVKIRTRLMR